MQLTRILREGFIAISRRNPGRCRLIDGGRDPEPIAAEIWKYVAPLAGKG